MQTRSQTYATQNATSKTPQKQLTEIEPQVNAPRKKHMTETPTNHGYCTRSNKNTEAIENRNLAIEFNAAFFDDASAAWNQNKKKIGNGVYEYIDKRTTRNNKKKIDNVVTTWIHSHFSSLRGEGHSVPNKK